MRVNTPQQTIPTTRTDHTTADIDYQPNPISQPANVLRLQRMIGNTAIQRLIKKQSPIQRSPTGSVNDDEFQAMDEKELRQVLISITKILETFEGMHEEKQQQAIWEEIEANPPQYHDVLMHWYRVSIGRLEMEPGIVWQLPSNGLATEIDQAVAKTHPFIQIIETQGTPEIRAWVENFYFPKVEHFRKKVIQQAVNHKITEHAEQEGRLIDPELKAQEEQILEALPVSISTLNDVMTAINAKGTDVVEPVFKKLYDNGIPDNVATLFQGKRGWIVLGELGIWLSAAKEIMEIADPSTRAKMFNEKLGWAGTAIGVTDVLGKISTFIQAAASVTCMGFAALAKVVGDSSALASALLGSRVVAEKLGTVSAWLTIVKGGLTSIFGETTADKMSGMADIAMGIGSLMGFAGTVGGVGAVLGHKYITVPTIKKGENVAHVGFDLGVTDALKKIKLRGDLIAHHYNRLNAALDLMVQVEHPEARAAYQAEIDAEKGALHYQMAQLFELTADTTPGGVGYYNVFNHRLFEVAPLVDADAPVGHILQQGGAVLDVIVDIFKDQDAVRKQAYEENPNPTWMQSGKFE